MERSELYRTTLEKYLALPKLAVSMGEKVGEGLEF
jgi:hypothetical protein